MQGECRAELARAMLSRSPQCTRISIASTKLLNFSPDSKVFPHGVTLNNVNAGIQLIRKKIQLIRVCISCICGATTAVSFPYQLYYFLSLADLADFADILIYKNHKNPFVLVETTSLMPCLYAWSFERGSMPKPTATPSIPTGFQPGQKKNPGSSNLKKPGCAYLRDPRDLREIINSALFKAPLLGRGWGRF